MKKRIISALLMSIMAIGLLAGCAKTEEVATDAVVDTIYIGHHYLPEIDPYYKDPITGEYTVAPDKRLAGVKALETVKEKLGVDLKWKGWINGATRDCLQTVLAGDPFAHMAVLSGSAQATVLTQNVLQPLDPYLDVFDHPDAEWIVMPEVFGHHYFMERDLIYVTDWPMVFNINLIEAVPELKDENGNTIFPYDLYREGKWTWSEFEKYLDKIQRYYSGKKGVAGNPIVPFNTNYIYAIQMALHSNGAAIYDGNALNIDTPEAIEAAEHLDSLITKGLVSCTAAEFGRTASNGGTGIDGYFRNGESVFTHMARWRMGGASNVLAGRGESMGMIFWPRPDDIPFTGEEYVEGASKYRICKPACDAIGLLRGFDFEESKLAVQAYVLYTEELYKNMGRTETIEEYRRTMAPSEAIVFGIDIFHPEVGDDNLKVFEMIGGLKANEFSENMGLMGAYCVDIFGNSVYGVGGSPKYAAAVKAKKATLYDRIDRIGTSLKATDALDAVAPSVQQKDASKPFVFPMGTDPTDIDWAEYFTANDNVDGTYDIKTENGKLLVKPNPAIEESDEEEEEEAKVWDFEEGRMSVDISAIDFNTTGAYLDSMIVKLTDSYNNTIERKFSVYIYDENSTTPPTLILKEEFGSLALETDTGSINWFNHFCQKAEDVNGVDLKNFVTADVSEVDVTVPGTYPITIYVEDFVGNRAEERIEIVIK
ncbi:MAG: carbohydrate ABC transporter substrate-binding protein [Clostridia bacterium]|nr:carbohydrate ABC transporter substrate-binding protein [Clostridia bacterium]